MKAISILGEREFQVIAHHHGGIKAAGAQTAGHITSSQEQKENARMHALHSANFLCSHPVQGGLPREWCCPQWAPASSQISETIPQSHARRQPGLDDPSRRLTSQTISKCGKLTVKLITVTGCGPKPSEEQAHLLVLPRWTEGGRHSLSTRPRLPSLRPSHKVMSLKSSQSLRSEIPSSSWVLTLRCPPPKTHTHTHTHTHTPPVPLLWPCWLQTSPATSCDLTISFLNLSTL